MQWSPNVWTLIRGNDESLLVHLLDTDKTPLNATGVTNVSLKVVINDGTTLIKVATQGFSYGILKPIFIYAFSFSAAETLSMKLGANQTVELVLGFGTAVKTIPYANCFSVIDEAIPA